ncbi:hypothetical protein AB0M46_13885 [Dactylosporangium sp. NPDC051485]|uniref:hypothetical protein n=1 Tax=Dactylosporangium sp. NPDC051485 TaxID=3154846 RepID=UPI003414916C
MPAPRLRLTCCLCRKPIAYRTDIYALDAEWQRRYPQMVGTLACVTCAVHGKQYYFRCERPDGTFIDGHQPAADQSDDQDFDSWSHIAAFGTQTALVYSHPWSAVQQGAEDWLRHAVQRPQLNNEVRAQIQDALDRWQTRANDVGPPKTRVSKESR